MSVAKFIFSPKRGRMVDFLNIVEQTGGMEEYDEVEKIYLKKDSGEAYFIKRENGPQVKDCFEQSEEPNVFLIGWKGSLEV